MGAGKIVQVIGTVVDIEFPPDQLPSLFDALEMDNNGRKLVLEVQQHIGNNWVRCLALGSFERPGEGGLYLRTRRDYGVGDTIAPICGHGGVPCHTGGGGQ